MRKICTCRQMIKVAITKYMEYELAIPTILIRDLNFSYDMTNDLKHSLEIIKDFDLEIKQGETVCIFGPNGCGKSTLLKLLTGLLRPQSGGIKIFGKLPAEINTGYIPQAFGESLFPWLKNIDNIVFPLYMNGMPKLEARRLGKEIANYLSRKVPLDHYPFEVSIGQKQIVALARALVTSPPLLLADEPYSALDFQAKLEVQDTFHDVLHPDKKISALLVSHHVEDAVFMGDRVIVLSPMPMHIIKIFNNPFPRPRTQGFKKSKEFIALVSEITEVFLEGKRT